MKKNMKQKNKGMWWTVIPLNPAKKKFHIIKKFALNNIVKRHTRTISKRDIGRLFRLTANDVNEVRIAKAEHEGKTPLVWSEFGYWHMRRHRELSTSRLMLMYGKLMWLIRH